MSCMTVRHLSKCGLRSEVLYSKMHQNPFGGRALFGPGGGDYSAPPDPKALPDPLAGFGGGDRKGERDEGKG